MTGRADRRYCSSACRQRAYRQREALARRGIAREDASAVLTASRLTNDQFEDVLRQARTDDDLSADHLAQLAEEVLNQP
jgi:ribosome-binding protein aMBF1 (putative translation factor)